MGEFRKTREVKETEPSTDTLRRIINIIFSGSSPFSLNKNS